jgi:hypothetical protein
VRLHERAGGEGPAEGFLDLPWEVYRDDPNWVPEDRDALAARLGPRSPWFESGAGRTFCVPGHARASVFRTPGLEIDGSQAAFFGHWESTGDARAEALVMDAARGWASAAGAVRLIGPVDLTPAVAHLLRIGGNGSTPYLGEPYNPPSYAAALAALGLTVDRRYASAELGAAEMTAIMGFGGPVQAELRDRGYRFEHLTADAWARHRDEILGLGIFAGNFGAGSVTPGQIRAMFSPAWAARLDPDISVLAFGPDGDVAGYAFCYADYGPLLVQGAGAARVAVGALSHATHAPLLRGDAAATFLVKTSGASPRHRRVGLAQAGLVAVFERALRKGMSRMITGPMHSENPIRRLFRRGQAGERGYALYAAELPA